MEPRLLRRLFLVLKRDIARIEDDMRVGRTSRELWFWKVFIGAYTTAKALSEGDYLDQHQRHGNTLQVLQFWFNRKIQVWSEVVGAETWTEARDTLVAMVWPRYSSFDESLAVSVWENALAASSTRDATMDET